MTRKQSTLKPLKLDPPAHQSSKATLLHRNKGLGVGGGGQLAYCFHSKIYDYFQNKEKPTKVCDLRAQNGHYLQVIQY